MITPQTTDLSSYPSAEIVQVFNLRIPRTVGDVKSLAVDELKARGFVTLDCAQSAVPGGANPRYVLRTTEMPTKQRGNLSIFAGKKVEYFTTSINRAGSKIGIWVKVVE